MKYAIGIDFGTLSGRAVLAELDTGRILADSVGVYRHGVMDGRLPATGEPLPERWALQDPSDYEETLYAVIPAVIRESGVNPGDIVGVGVDFTSASILPVTAEGVPLCRLPEFRGEKHAYVKLWKHHAARRQAAAIRALLSREAPGRLRTSMQTVSSESQLSKTLETLENAPEVYRRAAHFLEAGDWITFLLCGEMTQSLCAAGFKGLYDLTEGWPDKELLEKLHPELENYLSEKWSRPVLKLGEPAGRVTRAAAERTGLPEGCAVAVSIIDGHAAPSACGLRDDGTALLILGTGSTHTLVSQAYRPVEGLCGIVRDGIYPGYYAYEAGQCCVGDHYDWFASGYLNGEAQAAAEGLTAQEYLSRKAALLEPGESGLLALDWWNGSRSPYMDSGLRGALLGLSLRTRPEEIYRALVEATAFGARTIHDAYRQAGFRLGEIRATGGICGKSPLVMGIYADVLGLPIRLAGIRYGSALGSAMYAAVAAGSKRGGFDSIFDAMDRMEDVSDIVYEPDPVHQERYNALYARYRALARLLAEERPELGRGTNYNGLADFGRRKTDNV